ncbi:MAG: tetratricopeptide repeat protein [Myxococcota bacterium]
MDRKARGWHFTDDKPKLRSLVGFVDLDKCELLSEDRPRKALELCDAARDYGNNAAFWSTRGYVLTRLERYDEAIDSLDRALEILPQDVESLDRRGYALIKQTRYEEASHDLVLATRLNPVHQSAEQNLHHALAKLTLVAYSAVSAGNVDEGIETYNRVLAVHPRYTDALIHRGYAHAKKGDLERAERDYRHAIDVDDDNIETYRPRPGVVQTEAA